MIAQTTKTYSLFIATEAQQDRYNKRLLVSTLIDNGRGKQGRVTSFTMNTTTTTEDEIQIALDYALKLLPVPSREEKVHLLHSFSGSIDLPPGHAKVQLRYVSTVENPALQPLKNYIRHNPM
jgi:hypothetical protein